MKQHTSLRLATCSARYYLSHVSSRVLLGLCVLLLAISEDNPEPVLMVSVAGIAMIDGNWESILRALKVLRWLVIPILLLHTMFSGGELIWPGSGLPLTVDGLRTGWMLSLKLAAYFGLAMLLSRLLLREEVMALLSSAPVIGRTVYPYICMLPAIRHSVMQMIGRYRREFALRRQWKMSGIMLSSLFSTTFAAASDCAQLVWLRWPDRMPASRQSWRLSNELPVLLAGLLVLALAHFS